MALAMAIGVHNAIRKKINWRVSRMANFMIYFGLILDYRANNTRAAWDCKS